MSALFADSSDLYAIADRIARHADAARARANALAAHVARLTWRGVAADAFRSQAQALIRDLGIAAGRLDDAADALRRHAANVEHALHRLVTLSFDGITFGGDLLHGLTDLMTDPGNLLNDARSMFGDVGLIEHDLASLVGQG